MCPEPAGNDQRRKGADALVMGRARPRAARATGRRRALAEETGIRVSAPRLLHTKLRPASVHYTFGCELDGGDLRTSDESLEVAFVSPDEVDEWHTDHRERLMAALARLS